MMPVTRKGSQRKIPSWNLKIVGCNSQSPNSDIDNNIWQPCWLPLNKKLFCQVPVVVLGNIALSRTMPNTWTVATFFDCTVSLVTVFIALCRVAMASLMNYVQYSHTCTFQIQSQLCKQNCLLMSVYFHVCPKISKNKLWQIAFLKMQSGALWQNGLLEAKTWINVFPVFLYFFCFLRPPYSSGITFHRDLGIKSFTDFPDFLAPTSSNISRHW